MYDDCIGDFHIVFPKIFVIFIMSMMMMIIIIIVDVDVQVGTSQKMIVFRLGKMIGAKGPGTVLVFPWLDRYQVRIVTK